MLNREKIQHARNKGDNNKDRHRRPEEELEGVESDARARLEVKVSAPRSGCGCSDT